MTLIYIYLFFSFRNFKYLNSFFISTVLIIIIIKKYSYR